MVQTIVIAAAVTAAAALQDQNEWRVAGRIERAAPATEAWTEEDSAGSRSPLRAQARSKSVLLLVAGLTRHFEETWPKIRASLLEPNEAAGYSFTILVSTSTGRGCKPDSPKFKERKCEEDVDRGWLLRRIKSVMAPNEVQVLDHSDHLCSPDGSYRREMANITLQEDGGFEGGGVCAPWFARLTRVLEKAIASGKTFDRVVAIRPDIAYHRESNEAAHLLGDDLQGTAKLLLDPMCAKKPGFSFVTPTWEIRGRGWLHNRDLDFTHILCDGAKLDVYQSASRSVGQKCDNDVVLPPLPPGFQSTRGWHKGAWFCRFVQMWSQNNISIYHWDDVFHNDWH